MPDFARRATAVAFTLLIAVAAVGAQPAPAAAADLTVAAAEIEMVRLLNAERAKAGLVPVRVDSRLMSIARQRSNDMATRHYFSHAQPDGRDVFDFIASAGIQWYGAGEIIAWNTWPTLAESAAAARTGWMKSAPHKAIVMSGSYNYVGIGLAIDKSNGRKVWTGVFMKGPDRTGGWTKMKPMDTVSLAGASRYRDVTVSWSGGDIRLVSLTAGFRHHQIQVRTDGGAWTWWSHGTTGTSRAIRVWRGHDYDLRVRSCDKVGNCGGWANQHLDG